MKRITAYIRSHQLEAVKTAVADSGISGLNVADVRGCGNSPEPTVMIGQRTVHNGLPIRSRLTIIARDEAVESIIQAILSNARTGEAGDGKIFIEPMENAIRIRTLEQGETAV